MKPQIRWRCGAFALLEVRARKPGGLYELFNKYGTIIKFFCMQEKDLPKEGTET